jgi:K+-sensing histidine kinase KdpD
VHLGGAPLEPGCFFEKLDSAAPGQGARGSDVGLSTAMQIMKLHGGALRATCTPREGVHFTLALPRTLIKKGD